jgi:hypothetical protein
VRRLQEDGCKKTANFLPFLIPRKFRKFRKFDKDETS